MNITNTTGTTILKDRDVLSVSLLNRQARHILETAFSQIWVEGEISNLICHSSGHWYFSLKDEKSQVRCAMFKRQNQFVKIKPANGMKILIRAHASLYPERGEFQLIVQYMEDAGEGALLRAFEILKKKLKKEGLFDSQRKRKLPDFPKNIGVISSPEGAVIHDICSVLKRRCPLIEITLFGAQVQGKEAATQIIKQIEKAGKQRDIDAIIIARGGGSIEDLQPFNEETVARAIANCNIPVVSSIGHETDITITDFVADYRAPTPSAAAEMLSPDQKEWMTALSQKRVQLNHLIITQVESYHYVIMQLSKRLKQPDDYLREKTQYLDYLTSSLCNTTKHKLERYEYKLDKHSLSLKKQSPSKHLCHTMEKCQHISQRLYNAMETMLVHISQQINLLCGKLDACSPLQTLARGYSIVNGENGEVIRDSHEVQTGDALDVKLFKGAIECQVTKQFHSKQTEKK